MTTTHRNALDIGTRIDRYEIEAIIGHGGFGISYRAVDVGTGERIALKEFLPTELATREVDDSVYPLSESHLDDFQWGLERFLDEVNLLARFRHPSIVRVHRAFEGNGTAYMVMAFEEGESLATCLKREGTLDSDALVSTVMPLLDGLELVHDAGFIHRDIKPSNIYLRDCSGPVLLDFGSAREALRGKTRTLTALVSAGYAPLEQYFSRSDLQGPWSDIYGLGATLYEAISGAPPIDAVERSRGVLGSTRDILPPAAEVAARDYPPSLLAAVDHALRMEDQDRPRSIAEWRRELTGEMPVPERPETTLANPETRVPTVAAHKTRGDTARPLRKRHGFLSLVAVLLLATASIVGWLWSGMNEAIDNRIANPQPRTAEGPTDSRLDSLRETLAEANASAELSRKQIATLTARLSELESARNAELVQQPAAEADQARFREQDAIIDELRDALEAANRGGDEARRQADELATRLKLLEAVRATEDTELADRRKEIDGLLAAAEGDLRRLRLTTPAGANAYERYRRVLELDDSNTDARLGLAYIVEKYIELSARARDRGDPAGAAQYLDRASGVLPEHPGLETARNHLVNSEPEQESIDDRTRAKTHPAAATAETSARPPLPDTPLRVAILPTEWTFETTANNASAEILFAASLADDIVDGLVARSEIKAVYDYREGSSYFEIPDRTRLWMGNAVDRVPDSHAVYRMGEQLGVDAVLMWRAAPVLGSASWPVTIHLLDIDHQREFHVAAKNRNVAEALDTVVEQYLEAASIVAGGVKSTEMVSPSPVSAVSAATATTGPARVAMLQFARLRSSRRFFSEIISSELTEEIHSDARLRLVYSHYDPSYDRSFTADPDVWTGGPVTYQLDKQRAITVARELNADVIVTAQNPLTLYGQWGNLRDERDYDVDIYLLDVRREILYQDKDKIGISGETLSRLVAKAEIAGASHELSPSVPEALPLRVVVFPTSAGSWSSFNEVIVPDIRRQLTSYLRSETDLTLTYSFYADAAPGQSASPTYWDGIKALKKPDVPAIISAARDLGGDVAIAVFHWNAASAGDNIRVTRVRFYVIDVVNEKVHMRTGHGAEISRLADAAIAELNASRLALSGTGETDSVN